MHNLRSLRTGEPRGTEGKVTRVERVLFHIEVRTLYARRMFREQLAGMPMGMPMGI